MSEKDYKISIYKSLVPVIFLTFLLFFNILFFENNDWFGEYTFHYIILLSALLALLIGIINNVKFSSDKTSNEIVRRGLLEKIFGGVGTQQELPTTP